MSQRIIRLPAVLDRVGLSRSTLYAMIAAKEFPAQFKIGASASASASGWLESDIDSWIEKRQASRQAQQQ